MKGKGILVVAMVLTVGLSLPCAGARAYTGISWWSTKTSTTQAGGHPDLELHMRYDNRVYGETGGAPGNPCSACQDPRDIINHLPAGFIGTPSELPQCSLAEFATNECAPETQVGVFALIGFAPLGAPPYFRFEKYHGQDEPAALFAPIYNLPPHPEEAGLLGFVAPIAQFGGQISINPRTESDYGLDSASYSIFHYYADIHASDIWLWGVPAASSHDNARFSNPVAVICLGHPNDQVNKITPDTGACHPPTPSSAARVPFLSNPTACGPSLDATMDLIYYDNTFLSAATPWPATTGCDQLSFNPSLTAAPTTAQADAPSGLEAQLKVPQTLSPTVPTPSAIRATRLTLPPGFTINANAADGKTACTDAQAAFGTRGEARCPETSKIGTATLDTAALPGPIEGGIYLGEPQQGNRYRIFLSADGFATHVKLPGVAKPDPDTGQLEVDFEDLPQSPFRLFSFHLFGSERGSLATPTQCGEYPVRAEFVPWDSVLPNQVSTSYFSVDSGPNGGPCPNGPRPFAPRVKAGVVDNTAGRQTDFGFRLTRSDGEQNFASTTVATPPGLLASLKGIPYCPEAALVRLRESSYAGSSELASSACPQASRVGSVTTASGAGSRPLFSSGEVYYAGPYKGAPLSLAFVVPAVSGPYDLGNVVLRAAVYLDPLTAEVRTVTDPLPQIIEGIPLRLRTIQVKLDRPDFIRNPTNCEPFSIGATIGGDEGADVTLGSHFQVANCASLKFGPKLTLKLSGGVERRGHPAILATVRSAAGEANMRRVSVKLPHGEMLDNAHIGTVCTRVDFAHESCPDKSRLGTAEAVSPLLDGPLRGEVYLRSSSHRLPDLAIRLKGQIEVELSGKVDAVNGALRTTFEPIPDAPVSRFRLSLAGGHKGLIVNQESLCASPKWATLKMTGQNGMKLQRRLKVQADCGPSASRRTRRPRHVYRSSRSVR